MKTAVILASGPSLNEADVALVKESGLFTVAVSDAWRLAPWANVLLSQDIFWWQTYPEVIQAFAGRKLSPAPVPGVERLVLSERMSTSHNSGLAACEWAAQQGGFDRLLLVGFDMKGDHFFGRHPEHLVNTPPARFNVFLRQFEEFIHPAVEIVNCTKDSALVRYPYVDLREALGLPEPVAAAQVEASEEVLPEPPPVSPLAPEFPLVEQTPVASRRSLRRLGSN